MDDKRKVLYDRLSKDYELGDFDSFSAKLDDESKRKAFYDAVSKDYDLGDYESFVGKIKKPAAQIIREQSTGEPYTHKYDGQGNLVGGTAYETPEPYHYKPEVQQHIIDNKPDMFKPKVVDMYGAHSKDKTEMDLLREGRLYDMQEARQNWLQRPVTTFGEAFEQGTDALYQGGKNLFGEAANLATGSQRDYQRAKSQLDELVASGYDLSNFDAEQALKAYKDRDYQRKMNEWQRNIASRKAEREDMGFFGSLLHKMQDPSRPKSQYEETGLFADELQLARSYRAIQDALQKSNGNVQEAYKLLGQKASEETWGDETTREARQALASQRPTEGFGAWVGGMVPQMIGTGAGILASMNPYTRWLARPLGMTNMAFLTGATSGMSMAEARKYAEDKGIPMNEGEMWRTGLVDAAIEYGTEKIPFNRYFGRVQDVTKKIIGKEVADATLSNDVVQDEVSNLLQRASKEFRNGLFTKENLKEYLKDVGAEGVSEFMAEALQTLSPIIYQNPEDYPTLTEILNNGIEGAKGGLFMGAFLGAGSLYSANRMQNYTNRKRREKQGSVYFVETDNGIFEVLGQNDGVFSVMDSNGEQSEVAADQVKDQVSVSLEEFESSMNEARESHIQDVLESENASIDAATDPQTGMYGEVTMIDHDENGEQVDVTVNVYGEKVVNGKLYLLVEKDGQKEYIRPMQYYPETYQKRPAEEVKALNEEMIREESAAQAELESKYAPEVLSAQMQQGVPFNTPTSQIVPVSPMPEGNGWIVEEYAMDENGNPSKNVNVRELTNDEYRDMLQAQLDAEQAAAEQIASEAPAAPVEEAAPGVVAEDSEVVEEQSQVEAQQPQVEAQQAPVIPTKEDGSIDFVTYGKEGSFKTLGERYGEKMPNKVAVTAKAFAEDVAKAQTKLDKAQEAYDNAPIGREEKAKNARDKAQQELDAIKREADFWAEMDAEIKSAQMRRSEILNPQAQTEATNEPMTADEFVAQQLAAGNIVLDKDDYMRETGYGSEEANAMNGGAAKMFNENGMTIQEAGERLMEMDREAGTNFFDQDDATSGRDALISVLGSVKSRKELNQYIANNRAEQAKRDSEAVRNELEKSVMDANYSSLEDYVLQMEADEMENPFADVDLDRIDAIFAEAEEEYQNFINNEQGRTSEIVEGNDNVLPEEQSDNTGRTEGIEDEGNSDGNGERTLQQNEEAHAGEVGLQQQEGETNLQFAERAAKENDRRTPLRKRAREWSKALGVKVNLLESIDDVDARTRAQIEEAHAEGSGVPGWVAPNGEVYFFMPDIHELKDVDDTYIHEVVAHVGLPQLLGEERFGELCDKVWEMMPQSEKAYYYNYPGVDNINDSTVEGINKRERRAADEYIAHLAEKENLTPEEKTIWDNIVKLFRDMLDKALNGIIGKSKITDEDISNLIKASYANLKSGAEGNVSGEGTRFSAKRTSDRRQEMSRVNNTVDQALSLVYGKDIKEIRKERQEQEQKRKEDAAEIYQSVLSGDFNDVTLQKINDYIDDATPLHPYGKRISQRLPQKLERGLHEGARTNAVDALFSRICESAVPASRRASEAGRREIEERKKEALKGWAIATNNWHTDLSDFADEADFIRQGTDSKVYLAKDGKHVIKVSFGKPEGKRFRPDIDTTALFNSVFRNTAYEIVGYGEFDGKFARILKQPFVDFADKTALNAEEREEYMRTLGFEPINESKTAFSNGSIVAADLQKSNILKDAAGNISVIDADMKLHTKDVGGNYTYPPVEADLPEGTRFRIAYHGSAADFDKFSKDFIGSGEGQAVMGHGFYVTTSEGTSEYYANVASENKRKIVQEGGYTFNGEVVRDRALVSAYELLKDNGFDAERATEKANHRIEIFKKRKGIFANTATTEKAIEYLESEKNNPGSIGYQEEIIEKPSRIKYEVEIPDDTGKNYLDLDKKATKKFKDECKKRMIEILDNGEESSYWKKNRDIINDEWKSVDRSDATNDTVRGTMEQFISQEEVANVFSSMGFVGSKSKASDGTTYIIYNEDDIEIKDSTRFRFIGERGARNLDKAEEATTRLDNLSVAREMESAEKDAKAIKMATGWERGADGKWRYEVKDRFNVDAIERFVRGAYGKTFGAKVPLERVLKDDDTLLTEYPQLKETSVKFQRLGDSWGVYYPESNEIAINTNFIREEREISDRLERQKELVEQWKKPEESEKIMNMIKVLELNPEEVLKDAEEQLVGIEGELEFFKDQMRERLETTIIHEVQHAIQRIEGFEHGGNVDSAKKEMASLVKELGLPSNTTLGMLKQGFNEGYATAEQVEKANKVAEKRGFKDIESYLNSLNPERFYNNLSGEVEARNAARRSRVMNEEDMREYLASETEDVAREDQIFLNGALEEGTRFRRVYHGSGASFDRFDHSFMSSGEGNQSYGWGTYVTDVEGIARGYADSYSIFESGFGDFYLRKIREGLDNGKSFKEVKQELLDHHRYLYDKAGGNTSMYGDFISDYQKLMNLEESGLPSRRLYNVEIPDNNGTNYLEWDKPLSEENKKRIKDAVLNSQMYKDYAAKYGEAISLERLDSWMNAFDAGRVYRLLENFADNDDSKESAKAISMLLSDAGFVGFEYPANFMSGGNENGEKNYVIFNENDLKIVEHTRFRVSNRNQDIFVSNAQRAVEGIKQEKGTPQQWLAMIEKNSGLKAGEDKWLGLSDWLKGSDKKSLTKAEILDFIGENKIVIEEVRYGKAMFSPNSIVNLESDIKRGISRGNSIEDVLKSWDDEFNDNKFDSYKKGLFTVDENGSIKVEGGLSFPINNTRIHYTTEGLENKQEIALTVPTIEPYNRHDEIHFGDAGEGRAIAWIRFGETTTPNIAFINAREAVNNYIAEMREKYNVRGGGIYDVMNEDEVRHLKELTSAEFDTRDKVERVLVIDEIQSKRHQEGREKGYKSKEIADLLKETEVLQDKLYNEGLTEEEYERNREIRRRLEELSPGGGGYSSIPEAPFEKNWHELAMKRMLRYAAENGYDKVAWTTGAQQAERYGLGTVAEEVRAGISVDGERMTDIYFKDGSSLNMYHDENGDIERTGGRRSDLIGNAKNISEVVGKELASKILAQTERGSKGIVKYDGIDLSVGGEGMKGFYDKMLPSFVNKYVKKWGTKVQDIELPNVEEAGRIMHSVDVTDAMKESVMEGQTMFRISDKGRKIQNEVDKFTEKYNSVPVDVIESGMTDNELVDAFDNKFGIDDIRNFMKTSKTMGGYIRGLNKVIIFADKMKPERVEESLFHENIHALMYNENHTKLLAWFYEFAKDDEAFAKWREISENKEYELYERPEEFFSYVVSNGMVADDLEDVLKHLDGEMQNELKELLNKIGYDYDVRRRSIGQSDNGRTNEGTSEESVVSGDARKTAREQAERLRNIFGQVADMGLEGVLGNKAYTSAMVDIYKELPQDVRTSLADDALRHYKGSIAPAVSDYLNHNAEASIWDKVVGIIREALRKVGFDVDLNTNDVKYILWRSQKKLDRNNLLDVAEDIDKKYRLKVGEYNGSPTDGGVLEQIKKARAEVEKNPTEAQKEAGNYKKGHITLDGYDITLENPKGGTRSGTDKNGKKWSITMNNDYGYIRGTEAVDGDHIDIFLSDNPTEGNVFVVDQSNEDGTFDESKVMYGFNSLEEARQAYLSNYENGWESRIMAITEVPKDEFKKWIYSSHKKTKPFSEYKNVKSYSENARFRVTNKLNIRDEYEATIKKGSYQAREAVQDAMLSLRRVQELIEKATGKKLRDFENAWMHENRLSSVVQSAIHEMERKFYKPMMDAVKKLMDSASLEQNEVADYLMLKHGIERNREMAVRKALTDSEGKIDKAHLEQWYQEKQAIRNDATLDTWRKKQEAMDNAALNYGADMSRDYSGLTSMFDTDDLADCTEKAYDEVEALENLRPAETEALGKAVKAMTQSSLDKSFQSGLMDKKVYDELSNDMYDYYIPLRGFEETTSDEVYAYLDNERNAFNAPLMRAKGRTSKSDNPLAYMKSIAESGIMQGERNKMKQTFLNMVINNPSDLVSVKEGVWAVYNPATGEWEAASFPESLVPRNATPADVDAAYQQWEADMEQRSQQDPNVKKVSEADDVPYRVIGNRMNQHQVIVKRLGKSYTLTINGNPRLAMALNGLTNPNNTSNDGKVSAFVSGKIDALNRTLSAWYTTRNPDFVASNFMRDTFYTNTIVCAKEGNGYANQFHKYYANLLKPGKMLSLFYKYENGTLDASKPVEKDFLDFMMNGGETGYSNLKDLEHIKKQISKELKGDRFAMFTKAAEKLDLLNRAVENTARFAAFRTSRRMGRTIAKSVFDAKEISVNFNKKGSGGTFFGATGQTTFGNLAAMVGAGGRAFYVFFNAAIQGTTNLMHVMKVNPMGTGAGIGAMFLMGAVIPYLFAGDDDEEKDYYDLPEHVRRNHLIIPGTGDAWVSIPLPIEYRIMYGMGELLTSWRTGHEKGENIGRKMLSLTGQALPLNFLEEGFDAFMPSALSPVWQIYNNESWTGLPIYKDTDFNKQDPEYTKAYKNVDRLLYNFSKAMYEWTFDEENQKARIDLNPAMMETLARGYFGGLATQLSNLGKTYETIAGEREFDWRSIPVANRLFKTGDERTKEKRITNEYFENIEKLEFLQSRKRLLKKTKDGAAVPEEDKLRAEEDFKIMEGTDVYKKYMDFNDKKKKVDKVYRKRKEKDSKELETKYYNLMEEANRAVRQ